MILNIESKSVKCYYSPYHEHPSWIMAHLKVFIWRQKDATRNSIQIVAQSLYSHKELNNKNTSQLQEMIFQKDINWNDYPAGMKRGRVVKKVYYQHTSEFGSATRSRWDFVEPPIFTQDRSFLRDMIPTIESW